MATTRFLSSAAIITLISLEFLLVISLHDIVALARSVAISPMDCFLESLR